MKMEPNKFEQEAREKLAGRTINPSPLAWDRLDAMLAVAEQKPAKKRRSWLYMAACFLLMFCVGGYFLVQSGNESDDGDTNSNNVVVNKEKAPLGKDIDIQPIQQQDVLNNTAIAGSQEGSSSKTGAQPSYVHATPFHPLPQDNTSTEGQPQSLESPEKENAHLQKISVDANVLLASVQNQKQQAVKPAQTGVKVDANALLNGIEGDMDMRFRDRVFDKLAKGYDEVKEAVASRNYN